MEGPTGRLYEAAKALVDYIDREYVFDKSADMGCGGFDTYRSEGFDELIKAARKALIEFEEALPDNR